MTAEHVAATSPYASEIPSDELRDAALRLHAYLVRTHWDGQALTGPDVGIRFNSRIGRFVKSYLPVPARDDYRYNQAQGYWILANWALDALRGDEQYSRLALDTCDYLLTEQRPEGYWPYPNPEWRDRIATVEGNFAVLGLCSSHVRRADARFLAASERWYRFLVDEIGFQGRDGSLAINYFANRPGGMVPNNSTLTLRTLALLSEAADHERYLEHAGAMLSWLARVQRSSGEFPYVVASENSPGRPHFLCFQYNAFEFLDLLEYYRLRRDETVLPVLRRLGAFLADGLGESGVAWYDCTRDRPEIVYYTAAVSAALSQATLLGLGDYGSLRDAGYRRVLSLQRDDGGIAFFSRGDYRVLSDRRSYPRQQAMILYHLLLELRARGEWQ